MPRNVGGTGPSRRRQSSSPSLYTKLLQVIILTIALYAVGIVLWQNSHLNADLPDMASIISSTKDAFISAGSSSLSRKTVSESSWLFPDTGEEKDEDNVSDDGDGGGGAILPIDLSVNFLQRITRAPGAPPEPLMAPSASTARAPEDFLPVVVPSEVTFRWAHRARAGSLYEDSSKIKAYRIIVRKAKTHGEGSVVWDSKKVNVVEEDGVPDSVDWGESTTPEVGQILEWKVQVWDAKGMEGSSNWSKFAVGPEGEHNWKGGWITHPSDMDTFDKKSGVSGDECGLWKLRRPLPLFRAQITSQDLLNGSSDDQISSALLVISGLGSFRVSFDGVPLSTSGPIDPPFTDYSKRVMYRGFDVTPFLLGDNGKMAQSHVIGVTLGSGWWDHRPVSGMAKPKLLPRGPVTVIAQVMITYTSGKTRVVGQTGGDGVNWQVSRGHIRESDLFTGEMVDLGVLGGMEGWDTSTGWSANSDIQTDSKNPYQEINKWIQPVSYRTEVTGEQRKQEMALKAKAMERSEAKSFPRRDNFAAPIGKLVPHEIPPVMAMERIAPDEIFDLGGGRWLIDYGKAFSGMLHFDEGVPTPIIPDDKRYPRAHGFKAASERGDSFITVIYGESLEMTTGDINRVLVAGLGQHDGGPRHVSKKEGHTKNAYCFPDDHDGILSQKDVYVVSKASKADGKALFSQARQSHFTTHSFRFAEVCCSAEPPRNAHALVYRTAVSEWGTFDSSNVLINGGYELVKNAMVSNMLSVQSDCPHREKLPYGGDLVADSPAAMHMFDMSSFYKKTVQDWLDAQWDNGAYTETSVWQDLNDYAGIGHGAGETVWATAPPVLTVRHMQHYGDIKLLEHSLAAHVRWVDFLDKYFEAGMLIKGYDEELDEYHGQKSGLGDWLAMRSRDTFLTHTAFYMAAARCVAYIARKVGDEKMTRKSLAQAEIIRKRIASLYLMNGKDDFDFPRGHASHTPGPEMSLFSRIVPGEKRCVVLKNWFKRSGSIWPGDEETLFLKELDESYAQEMVRTGELVKESDGYHMGWSQWQGFNEGIFAIRYALKTLSDMGFHHIALRKAAGFGFATSEYMMRHNATTMWESWWRSEDLYSRNHPMLGAMAEWMSSSVAGVSHYPTTTGARKMLFWPRFPKSATTLEYASATQGTVRGDYSIAWRFEDLPADKSQYNSATVQVRVRFLVPPGGEGVVRPPVIASSKTTATLRHATIAPDLINAKSSTSKECKRRRKARLGFSYSWEFDREKEKWYKHESGKAIGTPCESYLFHSSLDKTKWDNGMDITSAFSQKTDMPIAPGLYEILFTNWPLEKEIEGTGRIGNIPEYYNSNDLGPYCKDSSTFEWDIDDGTHII
mmetsp:Transcript_16687/g.30306  ORF Transcript_16687/g.30306 Transcript_16687/m.30306 type:complete len:1349 (+) Transcript_16687:172-4218(+)